MPFGQLNKAQLKALVPLVRGKVIHDLGAGDLGLALELLNLGASKVIAIDKEYYNFNGVPPEIELRRQYFKDMQEEIDIAFVSWPANYDNGLLRVLMQTKTIIYLGTNMDGNSCGIPAMFEYLSKRKATQVLGTPVSRNTLICYTEIATGPRELFEEEKAAIAQAIPGSKIIYSDMVYSCTYFPLPLP